MLLLKLVRLPEKLLAEPDQHDHVALVSRGDLAAAEGHLQIGTAPF